MSNEEEYSDKIKEIVVMRLNAMPSNLRLSIGDSGSLSREEMIEHVKRGDTTGEQIMHSHLSFMKALARGDFTQAISSV